MRLMMTVVGTNLEREKRVLHCEIIGDDEHGLHAVEIGSGRERVALTAQSVKERNDVARAVMIDVVGVETLTHQLLQIVILFVGGATRSDDSEFATTILHFAKPLRNGGERVRPRNGHEVAIDAEERRLQALRVVIKVERVAALDAEEVAVDAGVVTIVAADDLVVADAECGAASVGAVRANRADVLHFPGAGLIAVSAAGERADGADIYAHAAFVALEMVAAVRRNFGNDAAVHDAES